MESLLLQLSQQGIVDVRKERGQWNVYLPVNGIVVADCPKRAFDAVISQRCFRTNPLIYERISNSNLRTFILAVQQSPAKQTIAAQEIGAILGRELNRRARCSPRSLTALAKTQGHGKK